MTVSLQDRLVTGATGASAEHVESAAPAAARPRRRWLDFGQTLDWRQRLLLGSAGWLVFFAGWYLAANAGLAPDRLFPGPLQVLASLQELFVEKAFLGDVLASVRRILVSFGLAVSVALPLGLLMGAFARVDGVLNPFLGA